MLNAHVFLRFCEKSFVAVVASLPFPGASPGSFHFMNRKISQGKHRIKRNILPAVGCKVFVHSSLSLSLEIFKDHCILNPLNAKDTFVQSTRMQGFFKTI